MLFLYHNNQDGAASLVRANVLRMIVQCVFRTNHKCRPFQKCCVTLLLPTQLNRKMLNLITLQFEVAPVTFLRHTKCLISVLLQSLLKTGIFKKKACLWRLLIYRSISPSVAWTSAIVLRSLVTLTPDDFISLLLSTCQLFQLHQQHQLGLILHNWLKMTDLRILSLTLSSTSVEEASFDVAGSVKDFGSVLLFCSGSPIARSSYRNWQSLRGCYVATLLVERKWILFPEWEVLVFTLKTAWKVCFKMTWILELYNGKRSKRVFVMQAMIDGALVPHRCYQGRWRPRIQPAHRGVLDGESWSKLAISKNQTTQEIALQKHVKH